MFSIGLETAWDRLIAADPGLSRLLLAACGVLCVFLAAIVTLAVLQVLQTNPAASRRV